jgi:superfamily I DNA and/or RNA helicase
MEVTSELIALQHALFDFSKRNPLVNVNFKSCYFPDEPVDQTSILKKLHKKSEFYWKEYGLATSLDVYLFIRWSPPQKMGGTSAKVFYTSPLFYKPILIKRKDRISTLYQIQEEEMDAPFLANPILQHYFKLFFDYDLPSATEDLSEEMDRISAFFYAQENYAQSEEKITIRLDYNEEETWQLIKKRAVGIFNYKKSALNADFEKIILEPNEQITQLLGDSTVEYELNKEIPSRLISELDPSQLNVIGQALNRNVAIQGPPGTGKSHTIVALIGAFLAENKTVLFVSEKRSALEVVSNRLADKWLRHLTAFLSTKKDQKKTFFNELKLTWDLLTNAQNSPPKKGESKTFENNLLSFYPAQLLSFREKLDGSLSELVAILLNAGILPAGLFANGHVPTYADWKKNLPFLLQFEKNVLEDFRAGSIATADFVELNSVVFNENEVVISLEKRLNDLLLNLEKIEAIQEKFGFDVSFDHFTRLCLSASILTMVDKVQIELLRDDTKKHTQFNSLAKKYNLLKSRLQQAEIGNQAWSKKPSLAEINELLGLLSDQEKQPKKGFLSLLRKNPAKLKTAFIDFHPTIGGHTKVKLLELVQLEWRLKGELEEVTINLKHDLNISDPENELELIFNLRNKLASVSHNEYLFLLEHQNSSELMVELSQMHLEIQKFNAQNRFIFQNTDIESIKTYAKGIRNLKSKLPIINHWLPELKAYFKLPAPIRNFIQANPVPVSKLNLMVVYHNLTEETRFESSFKQLSGGSLMEALQINRKNLVLTNQENLALICGHPQLAQQKAEDILSKPGFKLSKIEKDIKSTYRKEKRILLHEMNKQRSHLAVKTVFEATQNHLLKIKPLWMMNPLTVSEYLPCEADLFDVVIFDESSQIPLEDAIPAIYRAKQVVVVGDNKQMPPSAFFSSKAEIKTILDQAETVYANFMLKWHYRSKHPDLIRFSNSEFYQNDLLTFPPQVDGSPFELISTNGVYTDGTNEQEAKAIGDYCLQLNTSEKTVLIIAFSQAQEKEIQKELKKRGIHQKSHFQIRNLENVQGIEADLVLLSICYGKNPAGEFRLNFGPINQVNGANRLNVLLSRAIEKMVIFTSIQSTDFGYSDNKGVQTLASFLRYVETYSTKNTVSENLAVTHQLVEKILLRSEKKIDYYRAIDGIGMSAFIHRGTNRVLLVDPCLLENETDNLQGLVNVLEKQYAAVKIVLSLDLWLNFDRTEKEIIAYFS